MRMRVNVLLTCLTAGLLIFGVSSVQADVIILDDFTDGLSLLADVSANGGTDSLSETTLPGVLGGDRDSTVQVLSNLGPADSASLDIGLGSLAFSSGSQVTGRFHILYPSVSGLDVSAAGSQFVFDVLNNDQGGLFNLALNDGVNSAGHSVGIGAGVTGTQLIDVAANPDFATVDLTNLTDVAFSWLGNEDSDFTITGGVFFTTTNNVPEPASVAIWASLGLGLAGFGYYRTRRKK